MVELTCGIIILLYAGFHYACHYIRDIANKNVYEEGQICSSEDIDEICSICIENVNSEKEIRKVKCGHMFHIGCIDKWTQTNKTCPNCIAEIIL